MLKWDPLLPSRYLHCLFELVPSDDPSNKLGYSTQRSEKALVNEGVTIDDCQDEESDIEELHEMNEFEDFDDFEAMEDDEETRIIVDEVCSYLGTFCIVSVIKFCGFGA